MRALASRAEIDAEVTRLLAEAGALRRFPTPVEDLVAAQQLRLIGPEASFFSQAMLDEAPPELWAKMVPLKNKVLAMIDRHERTIRLTAGGVAARQRFTLCHELGHDLCPWHDERYYVDGALQLSPAVRALFEREANYAGAALLYQQDVFDEVARHYRMTFGEVKALAGVLGGSIEATLRRHVERHRAPVAGVVIGMHDAGLSTLGWSLPVQQVTVSKSFGALFRPQELTVCLSPALQPDLRWAISDLASTGRAGEGYLQIIARDGAKYRLSFQLATNSYVHFLLLHSPIRHFA